MLNQALKQIRVFHDIKQVELARKLGISKSYLSEIESCSKPVSLDLLQKYSAYFDIPVSSLMLFSEKIDSGKKSDKFRAKATNKILEIMEWINAGGKVQNIKKA
jgi:transcriptional regulator with XRE-family HTH domain